MGEKLFNQGKKGWDNLSLGQSAKIQFLFFQSYFNQGTLFGPFQLFRIELEEVSEIFVMTDGYEPFPSFARRRNQR
jgi:hypothetical protein